MPTRRRARNQQLFRAYGGGVSPDRNAKTSEVVEVDA
jgi:hypothetical protein